MRALGLNPQDVLDFSASISPLGPPAGLWDALRQVDLSAYPDPQCLELRETLARRLTSPALPQGIPIESIIAGNGSTELIHLLARAYLPPPPGGASNAAFLLTPTYGEYEGACRLAGASVDCLGSQDNPGFQWNLAEAVERIARLRPALVFLCNPNNPTGVYLPRNSVELLAEATRQAGGLLVVDEAYRNFVAEPWDSLPLLRWPNVVLLRSMTKDYALTSLRLGYALAAPEVVARLAAYQPDWSVNGLAQAAGCAALADADYLPRARRLVDESKAYLAAQFAALGFEVPPMAANFLLAKVGDAASWRERLARRGLFVRDCASFGLPEYIRVGIRTPSDCQKLTQAMRELCDEKPGAVS